jgi:hypothetical protein
MPYKNKCFSTCRKRDKPECNHPMCRYNNGKQYQYCRLSHSYKMNEECEPVLRLPKGKQRTRKAAKKIVIKDERPLSEPLQVIPDEEFLTPPVSPTKEAIAEFRERVKKANATRKIKKFFKKHQNKRRAHFLKAICSDADVCMAFGTEADKIKKHFDNFDNFDLIRKPAKRIGEVSANGFVKDLTYEKDGYSANAILKSSASERADNLLYEGLVGRFLNKVGKQYPCFVETYGIYNYDPTEPAYIEMKTQKLSDPMVLKAGLTKIPVIHPVHLNNACEHSRYMAVLIQHLNDAKTINELLSNDEFIAHDLLNVLYQVYMPLAMLSNDFTHYDLHYKNVLLYEPVKGKYIHYHYHMPDYVTGGPDIIVSFKCKYIAKIIDYGRCYFNDKENTSFTGSSRGIYTEVCAQKECVNCGNKQGFRWLEKPKLKKQLATNSFICSQIANQSHDLRLLYMVYYELKRRFKTAVAHYLILRVLDKINYGIGITLNKDEKAEMKRNPNNWIYYGTQEVIASDLPRKINNVTDAYSEIERLVTNAWFQSSNDMFYAPLTKLGDLHIYDDGSPMQYVPV